MILQRCPYCNCSFDHYTLAGQRKHMERCRKNKNRIIYTGNPIGHPSLYRRQAGCRWHSRPRITTCSPR